MWSFTLSKLFNILAGKMNKKKIFFFCLIIKSIVFQNQNNAKPPSLCPFCRGEIKGFESITINPFDSSIKQNKKELNSNEFDDVNKKNYLNQFYSY